jgi:hypothetical protein
MAGDGAFGSEVGRHTSASIEKAVRTVKRRRRSGRAYRSSEQSDPRAMLVHNASIQPDCSCSSRPEHGGVPTKERRLVLP